MRSSPRKASSLRALATGALLVLLCAPLFAADEHAARTQPAPQVKVVKDAAASDPLLQAMLAELQRSKAQLKMENVPAPYYIDYRVSELEEYAADAIFGALRNEQRLRVRLLRAVVRVGDYQQDSYFQQGQGMSDVMPLDDDPVALRHQLWLATDQAYKNAGEALTAKQALLKQYTVEHPVDDFARAPALQFIGPLVRLDAAPERWRDILIAASALYRNYPQVESLDASLRFTTSNQYFVNSEGSVTRRGQSLYQLNLTGAAQAPDGMRLERSPYTMVAASSELPTAEQFTADAAKMLETLVRLRQASMVEEEYRGPVLFAPDAASDVISMLIGVNVLGRKPAPGAPARTTGAFSNSYKSRVLPAFLSIVDDPTMAAFQSHSLVGSYDVDDEGVKAAPVTVIDKGELVNYLLGRQPIRDFPASNGHGRAGPVGPAFPSVGNLIVRASETASPGELKRRMLEMCKEQGKPYGYLVETLGGRLAPRLLYRVWVNDGHMELVRGAVFNQLDTRTLRNNLIAVGNDPEVSNRPGSVPSTVISPSLLLDELEVRRADSAKDKLPDYPPPPLTSRTTDR